MLAGERPETLSPKMAFRASGKLEVEMPLRYSAGIKASMLDARRAYRGKIALVNFSPSRRSFTRGCRTGTLPTPVTSSRSGWEPLRTTWRWSCSSRSSRCSLTYSATSTSSATSSIRRAPSRRSFSRSNVTSVLTMSSTSTAVYSRTSVSFLPPSRGSCRLIGHNKDTLSFLPFHRPSTTFEYISLRDAETALDSLRRSDPSYAGV